MQKRLPEIFLQNMKALLGEEYDAYLKSFEEKPKLGLRVNTAKISVEDFLKISPFHLTPVPWVRNGFYYEEQDKPGKHPFYYAGLYYLQEPSAMLPAGILPLQKGDKVLDVCAAPGGKSTEISARLNGNGMLFSNDISASRALALLKNLTLFGAADSFILSEDPKNLEERFSHYFDRILIDAPCSGEGMFRKEPATIRAWEEHGNDFFVSLQRSILSSAVKMLKPGGDMVYSTCTFSPLEDEQSVEYLLNLDPSLHLMDIDANGFEFDSGKPEWTESKSEEFKKCVRLFPHKIKGEGHFVALIHKDAENGQDEKERKKHLPKSAKISDEAKTFFSKYPIDLKHHYIEKHGERLYLLPNNAPDLSKIRVLRSGLFLGEEKKNRFEPAVDLALTMDRTNRPRIDLSSDDARVLRYLKCETLDVSDFDIGTKDYIPVFIEGYPLGFGKLQNGQLKNHYPKGWRYL